MNGYETIIFDLDGTLLDTLQDLHCALNHSLASQGLPERTFEETRTFVGNGIRVLVSRGVPEGTPAELELAVFDEFNRWYAIPENCNHHTRPYEGIPELVAALRAEGRRCAVVSNKSDYAVQELMGTYFPGAFDFVLGVREGLARKPQRDMCDAALAHMGVEPGDGTPGRLAYVGDSEVDIATAANAQMDCVSCTWGFRDRAALVDAGATRLVDTPEELGRVLRGEA